MSSEEAGGCCVVVFLVILGLAIHWCPWFGNDEEDVDLHDYAIIGELTVFKLDTAKFKIEYKSTIDKVDTQAEVNQMFELGQVKTIIDAAVSKRFDRIKLNKECLKYLLTTADKAQVNSYSTCKVYGDHKTTHAVYDPSIILAEMIPKREIYYGPRYSARNGYSTLITRKSQENDIR